MTAEKYRLVDGHLCRILPGVPPELKPEPSVTIARSQFWKAAAWAAQGAYDEEPGHLSEVDLAKMARKLGLEEVHNGDGDES